MVFEVQMGDKEMESMRFNGLTENSHSVVVLVNFLECQCEPSLLEGDRREELLGKLRKAVEHAGFGVVDGDIQPFGKTMQERNKNGATLNLILEDSGVSFDCYPEVGTVQMNLHYCNINNNSDAKVNPCIMNVTAVLHPTFTDQYHPIAMHIHFEAVRKAKQESAYAQLPNHTIDN